MSDLPLITADNLSDVPTENGALVRTRHRAELWDRGFFIVYDDGDIAIMRLDIPGWRRAAA